MTDHRESQGSSQADRDQESVSDLVHEIQSSAQEKAQGSEARKGRKRTPNLLYGALAILLLANAYLWLIQPGWLSFTDDGPSVEDTLRFQMYVQAQRIQAYERTEGTLPDDLEDTGTPFEGLEYRVTGPASWELEGEANGVQLTLTSATPLEAFMQGEEPAEGP